MFWTKQFPGKVPTQSETASSYIYARRTNACPSAAGGRSSRIRSSFWRRSLTFSVLCHVHNRQHPLEEDAARLLWQLVENGIDKRLCQFYSISLPQVPTAFHELHLGSIAASFQQRLQFIYREPKPPLKLFIYIVRAEHFLLLLGFGGNY